MEPQEALENLLDSKILAIIKLFLKSDEEYYLREISRLTRVSPASTYRILNRLVKINFLTVRQIKTARLYKISSNKTTELLKSLLEVDVIQLFVDQASQIDNVEEILLLGAVTKNKANILLLGNNVDTAKIKLLCAELREHYNFTINQMTLVREQYEQMSAMGLYPGSKTILYRGNLN